MIKISEQELADKLDELNKEDKDFSLWYLLKDYIQERETTLGKKYIDYQGYKRYDKDFTIDDMREFHHQFEHLKNAKNYLKM